MVDLLGLIFFILISLLTGFSICLNIFSKLKHKVLASYLGAIDGEIVREAEVLIP